MTALPTLQTDRLILRPLADDDLTDLYRLVYADPEVYVHFGGRLADNEARRLHDRKVRHNRHPDNRGFGYWAIVHRESKALIGQLLLGPPESVPWISLPEGAVDPPLDREVELGYALGRAYWGRGYASEACRRAVGYAFGELGLQRLVNGCRRANASSFRLMQRLGFAIHDNSADAKSVVGVLDNA